MRNGLPLAKNQIVFYQAVLLNFLDDLFCSFFSQKLKPCSFSTRKAHFKALVLMKVLAGHHLIIPTKTYFSPWCTCSFVNGKEGQQWVRKNARRRLEQWLTARHPTKWEPESRRCQSYQRFICYLLLGGSTTRTVRTKKHRAESRRNGQQVRVQTLCEGNRKKMLK